LDRRDIAAAQRFSQILSPDAPHTFEKSRLSGADFGNGPFSEVVTKSGTTIPLDFTAWPFHDDDGLVRGIAAFFFQPEA
jgi:hypothetical protein